MADERSPLLQNGRDHDGEIDYSAVNAPEQIDSVAIHGSSDAEQQQTAVAPQNSVVTLVGLGNFRDYLFYSDTAYGKRLYQWRSGYSYVHWTKRLSWLVCNQFFLVAELGEAKNLFLIAYASIGSDLNELQNTSWIATSYLLTTTSFQ